MSSYKNIEEMDSLPTFISCDHWVTTRFEINDIRSRLSLPHGSRNCDICQLLIVSYIIIPSSIYHTLQSFTLYKIYTYTSATEKKYRFIYNDMLNHSLYSMICFTLWKSIYTCAIFLNVSNHLDVSTLFQQHPAEHVVARWTRGQRGGCARWRWRRERANLPEETDIRRNP